MVLNPKSPFYDRPKIMENDSAFAIYDGFAISPGHTLVIPKKQVNSIFDLNINEYQECFDLVRNAVILLKNEFATEAFNIGINNGIYAGQTIAHAHIHIIPRYKNDIQDPRGGVRNILPDKSGYLNKTIDVVAAVIKKDNKFMIARRSSQKDLPGFWEYPGGKVEDGESDQEALKRELQEEFGIQININQFLTNSFYRYEKFNINLRAYLVEHISGDFMLKDHDQVEWITNKNFNEFKFAPADLPINNYIMNYGI
jgi:8-oxo-dGTP diphosphatase